MRFPFARLARRIRTLRALRRDRGAIMVLAVPVLSLCVAACALGVDIGRIAVDERDDQRVADLAALDAARAVGAVLNATNQAGYDAAAQTAANASAVRNGFSVGANGRTVTALVGTIDSATNAFSSGGGADAVQVTTTSTLDYAFLPGSRDLTARAVAFVGSPIAAFSLGGTLASVDTSKSRLDPMLKTMLGASGNLTLVSYDGLAGTNVTVSRLQAAMINQGLSAGTVSDMLRTQLTVGELLAVTASALTAQGADTAAAEVNDIINTNIGNSTQISLGQLLTVASPSDRAVLSAGINVFQLVTGAAQLANGTNLVSVPLSGVNLSGLGGVTVSASVIEPAKTAIGPVGTTTETAQVRLRVTVNVTVTPALVPVPVQVTLDYTTAEAVATLSSLVCGATPSVGITGQSSAVSVSGTGVTALGNLGIASAVNASSLTPLSFNHPSEFAPVTKHLGGTNSGVALASVSVTGSGATAALAPLLEIALPLTLSTLDAALQPAIRPLLRSLGVAVGQADVAALGIYPDPSSCGGQPRLAQ